MTNLAWLFDILLGASLLWLAVRAIYGRTLFDGVISFIGLGMLMALAWLRLDAPDVALAEAALGGGVTRALLFAALKRLQATEPDSEHPDGED